MNLIDKYLNENKKIEKAKKELKFLRQSRKMGKLTKEGQRRLDHLQDMLAKLGVFD
jgi:DNA-binding transcriptional LysR family regulator